MLGALTVFDCRTRLTSYGKQTSSHLNPSLDFSPRVWKGGALQAAEKTMWCLALALSAPPRRTARHPSSSEEGSVFNNSPPDSGGVAPRAPGWSYAEDSFSSACLAPPVHGRGEKSALVPIGMRFRISCCETYLTARAASGQWLPFPRRGAKTGAGSNSPRSRAGASRRNQDCRAGRFPREH